MLICQVNVAIWKCVEVSMSECVNERMNEVSNGDNCFKKDLISLNLYNYQIISYRHINKLTHCLIV